MSSLFVKYWQYLFLSFSLIFIFSTFYVPYPLSWLFKVLPMLILLIVSFLLLDWKHHKWFVLGLLFSATGDFILDYFGANGFIFGLGAFFIAHVFYLIYFGRWQWNRSAASIALIVLTFGSSVVILLLPNLGNLFYPVIGYMLVLTLMAFASMFSIKSNKWFILGGLSFVLSDSILGLNKFYLAFDLSHILIMISYYLAQFFLLKGCIECHNRNHFLESHS